MYSRLYPGSGGLYAPDQGSAMALIFAVLVVVVGVGLRAAVGRRLGARTHERVAPTATAGADPAPQVPLAVG